MARAITHRNSTVNLRIDVYKSSLIPGPLFSNRLKRGPGTNSAHALQITQNMHVESYYDRKTLVNECTAGADASVEVPKLHNI